MKKAIEAGKTYKDGNVLLHVKNIRGKFIDFQADNRPVESVSLKTFLRWVGKEEQEQQAFRLHDHKKLKKRIG